MSAAKIGYLFLKTLSKPVANHVKNYTKNHQAFKELCISIAQRLNRTETRLKNLGAETAERVRPLNDARAIEVGANFIGEATLFTLGALIVIMESTRSYKSNKSKELALDTRIANIENVAKEALERMDGLKGDIEKLRNEVRIVKEEEEKLLKSRQQPNVLSNNVGELKNEESKGEKEIRRWPRYWNFWEWINWK
ncbi:optic atrophy 3 protein-domain-containing protein [Paraphysoderma sedebokerense]|nr:optic atrophy 3 protein-domain-containing protein [Paraphysoderma sedebokerense]